MRDGVHELLRIAKDAARAGADVHLSARQRGFAVRSKQTPADLVTDVDRESERQVVSFLRAARPDDAIVGEEGSDVAGGSGVCWIIDPLDGTTNFVHGYPAHAVAVGVEIDGRRALGVVCDTFHNRLYEGLVGGPARCDEAPIAVRHETDLSRALIGTGFLPSADVRRAQADVLRQVLPRVRDVRRSGCPSLDLCAVASGALDGFYECGLGRWDIAAGAAIAEAAGATVVELDSLLLPNPLLIVANAKLLAEMIALLAAAGAIADPPTNYWGNYR